jgi:predicted RNA-binding protein YlxR (DUF448 family)
MPRALKEVRVMNRGGHAPVRRCLGCRKRGRKDEFIRLVYVEGKGLVVDREQRMPGRGAYLCNAEGCFRRGLNAKVISSAFRRSVMINEDLRKSIEFITTKEMEGTT